MMLSTLGPGTASRECACMSLSMLHTTRPWSPESGCTQEQRCCCRCQLSLQQDVALPLSRRAREAWFLVRPGKPSNAAFLPSSSTRWNSCTYSAEVQGHPLPFWPFLSGSVFGLPGGAGAPRDFSVRRADTASSSSSRNMKFRLLNSSIFSSSTVDVEERFLGAWRDGCCGKRGRGCEGKNVN